MSLLSYRVLVEPQQGATYDQILRAAQAAEQLGYDGFFRSDHILKLHDEFDGRPGPTEAWTTLAGLARDTNTIRLGTLVSPVTLHHPSLLAIKVAQIDHMSNGRIELGLGAGWYKQEHKTYGIPFPAKRFDRLEESLEIISGFWHASTGDTYSFVGEHFHVVNAPALAKPLQESLPLIVGGRGLERTPALAARYAAEFNVGFTSETTITDRFARLRMAAAHAGRDYNSILRSVALPTVVGRTYGEYQRRLQNVYRDPNKFEEDFIWGSPAQAGEKLGRLAAAGVQRVYFQFMDLHDLDHVHLIANEVIAQAK